MRQALYWKHSRSAGLFAYSSRVLEIAGCYIPPCRCSALVTLHLHLRRRDCTPMGSGAIAALPASPCLGALAGNLAGPASSCVCVEAAGISPVVETREGPPPAPDVCAERPALATISPPIRSFLFNPSKLSVSSDPLLRLDRDASGRHGLASTVARPLHGQLCGRVSALEN